RQTTKAQSWFGIVSRPCFEVWLIAHYEQVRRYADQKDAQTHYRRLLPEGVGAKEVPPDFPYDAVGDAVRRSHLQDTPQPPLEAPPPRPGARMPHLVRRLGLVSTSGAARGAGTAGGGRCMSTPQEPRLRAAKAPARSARGSGRG